ncbi:hypothetical protein NPX13_g6961 [Xylaria arbuscula]|uniref:DUF6594 domain-containing protein n=1 Tax=Xylaria arbuscula TaxID=114810 RepID=A0A9W8TL91_9PEZI|nr:hypothetical protein NPX13_g6961 [Xylaria arbuscula]
MVEEDTPVTIDLSTVGAGGYPKLAEFMVCIETFYRGKVACLPELMVTAPQLAIFRRFASLTNVNLLYLQAEIAELEVRLQEVQTKDSQLNRKPEERSFHSWFKLSESADLDPGSLEREPYELIMKLRELMAQYHEALFFQKEMLALRTPHIKILEDLREWMKRPKMGCICIFSGDWRTWIECNLGDLVTFENSTMDRFTSLVTYTIIDVYHSLIGRHIHKERETNILPLNFQDHRHTVTYTHRSIARFTQAFTVLIACTLPIAAIIILYFVHDMPTRLGIIATLTGLFSTSMSMLTTASLQDIFAATAAFAAVLVFFLGSTNAGL